MRSVWNTRLMALAAAAAAASIVLDAQEVARFKSGVELINVTATVVDRSGRFVAGLQQSDFTVYEDERRVEVTHFSSERAPISLGIVLDTSGSMAGEKLTRALAAIEAFLDQLLTEDDEVFVYGFSSDVEALQEWTTDRRQVSAALRRVRAVGGTAMYDAVVRAVPVAQEGRHRKKAVVLISDGNDTNSRSSMSDVRRVVQQTEVLIYAVGIDGDGERSSVPQRPAFPPLSVPALPGRGGAPMSLPAPPQPPRASAGRSRGDRLNASALREITDSSGGRTEIVRRPRDLDPATANIAEELRLQYYLGYASPGHRDGRWHTIRVEVRDSSLRVRARRGYVAS